MGQVKLMAMPFINLTCFTSNLVEATMSNNGGFRLPPNTVTYSPIDLMVALLSQPNEGYKNLKEYFSPESKDLRYEASKHIFITIKIDDTVETNNLIYWKHHHSKEVQRILRYNAPFTMRKD